MHPSKKSKEEQGRGQGLGADYKPDIYTPEIDSKGTASNFVDWKTGRAMQLPSQIELAIYLQGRWRDDVVDIREQFPLNDDLIDELVDEINARIQDDNYAPIKHFDHSKGHLTTDLLLTLADGSMEAISVKYDKHHLSQRQIERQFVEKQYWTHQGVPFHLLDKSDVNPILVQNIRLVTEYYNKDRVFDWTSAIKYLIAHKILLVDMESEVLDFTKYRNNMQIQALLKGIG